MSFDVFLARVFFTGVSLDVFSARMSFRRSLVVGVSFPESLSASISFRRSLAVTSLELFSFDISTRIIILANLYY